MKLALLLALSMSAAGALAQQAPASARPAPPARVNNEELMQLLREQTAAVKALALKVDALEVRIAELEMRQR